MFSLWGAWTFPPAQKLEREFGRTAISRTTRVSIPDHTWQGALTESAKELCEFRRPLLGHVVGRHCASTAGAVVDERVESVDDIKGALSCLPELRWVVPEKHFAVFAFAEWQVEAHYWVVHE